MITTVQEIPGSDDVMIEIPQEILDHLKAKPGDILNFEEKDGVIYLTLAGV